MTIIYPFQEYYYFFGTITHILEIQLFQELTFLFDLCTRYFVASNAIACSYAALSILLLFTSKGENNIFPKMIIILDTLMVALVFSSNGAATAIALMGYKGNSHVQWKEVCSVFGKFCDHGAVAIGLSQLGALAFLLLVLMSALSSNKRSSNYQNKIVNYYYNVFRFWALFSNLQGAQLYLLLLFLFLFCFVFLFLFFYLQSWLVCL